MRPAGGFGGRSAAASSRPALLVVDMSLGFSDPESPLACDLEGAVGAIGRLLAEARCSGAPVVFTTVAYAEADLATAAAFLDKAPALRVLRAGDRLTEIDPRIAPAGEEPVLVKLFASAFFATPLQSLLAATGRDSLVVCGASTSGCVRATVVDAVQHGYPVMVPRGAVGDRDPRAHEQSLRDIDGRYGDVVDLEVATAHLAASG